jgi:hypothetical protein
VTRKKDREKLFGMTRGDIMLGISLLLLGGIFFVGLFFGGQEVANKVEVKVNGKIVGVYSLAEDQEISLKDLGENTFEIREAQVEMIKADCPDQYCVKHYPISKNGESIICLPNKVVITIKGKDEGDVDAVSNE